MIAAVLARRHANRLRAPGEGLHDELHRHSRRELVKASVHDVLAGDIEVAAIGGAAETVALVDHQPRDFSVLRQRVRLHVITDLSRVLVYLAVVRNNGVAQFSARLPAK